MVPLIKKWANNSRLIEPGLFFELCKISGKRKWCARLDLIGDIS